MKYLNQVLIFLGLKSLEETADAAPKLKYALCNWFGSHFIYTMQTTVDFLNHAPVTEFYWKDDGSPQGFGPFPNISETMEHYTWYLKMTKETPHLAVGVERKGKLIRVDFYNKKRVDV